MPPTYEPRALEAKWRQRWDEDHLYHAPDDDPRPKWYELTMYPYPSGDLHIGHWYSYVPHDTHARFMRMRGHNVMSPIGFDAFGLPAENAAIKHSLHPYKWTMDNIQRMREQLRSMGTIFDWDRELVCCLPDYYQWNQWFFLQFYEKGLAYRAYAPANWCPGCQTVLANEQVKEGRCERSGDEVERRDLEQWFLRITDYAEELLDFGGLIDWPEKIKTMQRNWIGRSEGVQIKFDISHHLLDTREIEVFTTRPDTAFGVTFMVLAPEHPLVEELTTPERRAEVKAYVQKARNATEIERMSTDREKTGVPIGADCINPFNDRRVPIYVADYVLLGYGTGAVMAVPAHDDRDFEFANKHGLPINIVISPPDWDGKPLSRAHLAKGTMVNSGPFNGTTGDQAFDAVADFAEADGLGRRMTTYRMRDWLISRQRYWGTPIPIVYCDLCGTVPVPENQLPVLLPDDAEFKPTGESPLAHDQRFLHADCPKCGGAARRETDTMDTFVDSSWYYLRYVSPGYTNGPFDPSLVRKWAPVDQYTGGAEHAVMHLLYARFFAKALRDVGVIDFNEPFLRLFNQGIILGEDHEKMSKSRGNVINPDDQVAILGSDAVRAFLMFVGPWDQGGSWSTTGIRGISRWFNRIWDLSEQRRNADGDSVPPDVAEELRRETHRTVKKVDEDFRELRFNTAIAALMTLTNSLSRHAENDAAIVLSPEWRASFDTLTVLLAPIAPHLTEELWEAGGHEYSVHNQSWPSWDEGFVAQQEVTLVVQVDGKLRDRLTVPAEIDESTAREMALASEKVRTALGASEPKRIVYVSGRLVNIVTH